jgi:hypothetical protein
MAKTKGIAKSFATDDLASESFREKRIILGA